MYILILRDDKEAIHYDDFDYDDMLEYIRDEGLWNNFYVIHNGENNDWGDVTSTAYDDAQTLEQDRIDEANDQRMEAPIVL